MRPRKLGSTVVVALLLVTCFAGLNTLPIAGQSGASQQPSSSTLATVSSTTHAIEYHIGLPQSMVDDGEIQYFGAHGFTTVYLVAGDTQPYTAELNTIKSLGMKPVIDVEFIIWDGGRNANTPISSYTSYFQSLKNAGWQYVASEGGRQGDASYLVPKFFKGYINFNCDQCGLWKDMYKEAGTVRNSWESYYPSEVQSIQQGTLASARLGIRNGLLAGVWANANGNNQLLTNSRNGRSPSYKSMLDWSYANGVGFTSFGVWFHPGQGTPQLPLYKQLGFEQIVATLQASYPASGQWTQPTQRATSLSLSAANGAPGTYTFSGSLTDLVTGKAVASASVYLHVYSSSASTWELFPLSAGHNPATTSSTGSYSWSNIKLPGGAHYYRAYYAGDATHLQSFAPSVQGLKMTAPTPTTTTITASRTFVDVKQPVTFTVTVKAGSNALARPVHIWHTTPNGAKYDDGTHTTSGGKYAFTVTFTTAGKRTYYAEFAGDTTYGASSGYKTVYTGYTITRITASNTNPTTTQPVTFTVTVKDYAAGTTLVKLVHVWHTSPSGAKYDDGTHMTTGGQLTWTVTSFGSTGVREYHADFAGDAAYMPSSGTVTVLTKTPTS